MLEALEHYKQARIHQHALIHMAERVGVKYKHNAYLIMEAQIDLFSDLMKKKHRYTESQIKALEDLHEAFKVQYTFES